MFWIKYFMGRLLRAVLLFFIATFIVYYVVSTWPNYNPVVYFH